MSKLTVALTVVLSLLVAAFVAWFVASDRLRYLRRPIEEAAILVVPGPSGKCAPVAARPVIRAHPGDDIEWEVAEFPGCQGEGRFDVVAKEGKGAELFDPPLQRSEKGNRRKVKVTHKAHPGDVVLYSIELENGEAQDPRIEIW